MDWTYLQDVVVPYVDRTYPTIAEARGRMLLGFSKTGGNARAYIFSIANNLVIDRFRHAAMCKRHGLTEVSELPEQATDHTPERSASAEAELQRVKAVLMRLNPRVRRAFILSRFKYMSYRQIADDLGVKQKRVEKYISAALAALRKDRKQYSHHG